MIRVFPRTTKWSPTGKLAFFGPPPSPLYREQCVRVSVTFTWDIERGRELYDLWSQCSDDCQIGGPAFNDPGGEFVPGRFIKKGVTITSRGCPKNCPWCYVPKREGRLRELPIRDGWIVQDNNLLACSFDHIVRVFEMLHRQPLAALFPGGLDLDYLQAWHVDCLKELQANHKFGALWVAFDGPQGMKKLDKAIDMLADFSIERKFAYVLIGFDGDTIAEAEKRCATVYEGGFLPFAMLHDANRDLVWKALQRKWARPTIYRSDNVSGANGQ